MKEEKTPVFDGSPVEKPSPVNHPSHYNGRADGLECIDIIRHYPCDIANAIKYLWRAGLKQDADKSAREKEVEDLRKAIWYIQDYLDCGMAVQDTLIIEPVTINAFVYHAFGTSIEEIANPYPEDIRLAMQRLLYVGFSRNGVIYSHIAADSDLREAIGFIQSRIDELQNM